MSKDDPTTLAKKWATVLKTIPEFKDIADAASTEDLKKMILTCEGNLWTLEKEKENDAKLIAARENMKEWSAPYSDAVKIQTAKIKYALFLLEGKGVELDSK
jgi:hypothetical protein